LTPAALRFAPALILAFAGAFAGVFAGVFAAVVFRRTDVFFPVRPRAPVAGIPEV
jgi:hypothetical protein